MTVPRRAALITLASGAILAVAITVGAQTRSSVPPSNEAGAMAAGLRANAAITNAPYSADAITTVTQVLGDGTRVVRSVTAKIHRNSAGSTRRDQTVFGLASLTRGTDARRTITITDPVARVTITLDERTQTAQRAATPLLSVGPGNSVRVFAVPQLQQLNDLLDRRPPSQQPEVDEVLRQLMEQTPGSRGGGRGAGAPANAAPTGRGAVTSLGTRQIEGLSVTGKRTTQTIPAGEIGNDRPIVITDEAWTSDALRVVVASKHSDPRTGTVDYRLENITLGEPPADLFIIPSGYTVIDISEQRPNAGGARGRPQ